MEKCILYSRNVITERYLIPELVSKLSDNGGQICHTFCCSAIIVVFLEENSVALLLVQTFSAILMQLTSTF